MVWKPHKYSHEPLYQQIVVHVKNMVREGHYKSGHQLSIRKLAYDYEVGVNTIKCAFENLKAEGILTTSPRSSTIVAHDAWRLVSDGAYDWSRIANLGKHIHSSDLFIEACKSIADNGGLGLNVEEFNPALPVVQAIKDIASSSLLVKHINDYNRYGFLPLREEVVKHIRRLGIDASVDSVVIFNGAFEAYNVLCSALLRPGMNVYELEYGGNTITKTVQSTGANVFGIKTRDIPLLHNKITKPNNSMLHICGVNHFVTGVTLTKSERDDTLSMVKRMQLPVLEHDPYRDIYYDTPPPPLKAGDVSELVIYVGAFSQLVHAGNFKLAWGIIPPAIKERVCDVSLKIYNTNNIINEIIGYIMLKEGYYSNYILDLIPKVKKRVDAVDEMLTKYLGTRAIWNKQHLAHFIWAELPGVDEMQLLKRCGSMLFAPGSVYGAPNHINMNTLYPSLEELDNAIRTISANIK